MMITMIMGKQQTKNLEEVEESRVDEEKKKNRIEEKNAGTKNKGN